MKKTLLVTLDFPPQTGGVANYLFQLCFHLPSERFAVLTPLHPGFVGQTAQGQAFESLNRASSGHVEGRTRSDAYAGVSTGAFASKCDPNFRVYRKQCLWWNASLGWIPLFWHIFRLIQKEQIEKIWVGQILPVGTVAWLLKSVMKIPYIVSVHGMDILSAEQYVRKRQLMKWILHRAEWVAANSEFTAHLLQTVSDVPRTKIRVVYPCPSVEMSFAPLHRGSLLLHPQYDILKNISQNHRILLSVGRLVERKGFDHVLQALPEVLHQVPDVHYIIAGDGPYRENLQILIEKRRLAEKVTLLGYVSQEMLKWLYQHAKLFIMPSRERQGDVEGFGMVFLEANSFGIPVIGGRSGGISEAVIHEETGLLVDPNNVPGIAQAIITLFSNPPLAQKLGENGRQRVLRDFQWSVQAKILQTMLQ